MDTENLSGKNLAAELRREITASAQTLKAKNIQPTLAIVIATDDDSTGFYVRNITRAAEETGVKANAVSLPADSSTATIAEKLTQLANDDKTHGIILQTPLPDGVNADELRSLIPPGKDVDGANPLSAGRLFSQLDAFAPSTALAVMEILNRYEIPVQGTNAVIIGRSRVVGKPLAHLLLDADATVTICHSKTRELNEITKRADLLVVAVGQARMVNADYVKTGAVVIDVGTNPTPDGLVGDVDHMSIQGVAGAFSPVPGGVGPVTTAILLKQTISSAQKSAKV